jgi:hypothetical protein
VEGAARPGRRPDVLPGQAAQRPGRVSISLLAKKIYFPFSQFILSKTVFSLQASLKNLSRYLHF